MMEIDLLRLLHIGVEKLKIFIDGGKKVSRYRVVVFLWGWKQGWKNDFRLQFLFLAGSIFFLIVEISL